MSKKIAVLLAPGFEDAEAIVTIDVLRRLELDVEVLACQDVPLVLAYKGTRLLADAVLGERQGELYDGVVLPGGPQGARNLGANSDVVAFVAAHQAADRWIFAICSAGAHVLAANNLLQGKRYVCSGENYKLYADGSYVDAPLVEDGKVLTCKGLGLVFEFAFAIGKRLGDVAVADTMAEHIYLGER